MTQLVVNNAAKDNWPAMDSSFDRLTCPTQVSEDPTLRAHADSQAVNDQILVARYAYNTLCKGYPFAEITACDDEDEAYWWALQYVTANPDEALHFREDLPVSQENKAVLRTQWANVCKDHTRWVKETRDVLVPFWQTAPNRPDDDLDSIIASAHIEHISDEQKRIIAAIVPLSLKDRTNEEATSDFEKWQITEKSLRYSNYQYFQEYVRSIRLYYELLIQSTKPDKQSNNTESLEADDPVFIKAVIANRIARVVDGAYHANLGSKAMTNEQRPKPGEPDKRLRKKVDKPKDELAYSGHPYKAMLMLMRDTLPYYINKPNLPYYSELVAHLIAAALHDIPEDSRYDEQFALQTVENLLHHFDTHFCQIFERSPNGLSMKEFLETSMNLFIGRNDLNIVLTPILRSLNKNYKLDDDELQAALVAKAAGNKTKEILKAITRPEQQEMVNDDANYNIDSPGLKLFDEFPDSAEFKMDCFIVKLLAIADAAATKAQTNNEDVPHGRNLRRIIIGNALSVKASERCHNTNTIPSDNHKYALRTLRANSTRLIPFVLETFQQEKKYRRVGFSTYNVLPRLIDSTQREYQILASNQTVALTDADSVNMSNLNNWASTTERHDFEEALQDKNADPRIHGKLVQFRISQNHRPPTAPQDALAA